WSSAFCGDIHGAIQPSSTSLARYLGLSRAIFQTKKRPWGRFAYSMTLTKLLGLVLFFWSSAFYGDIHVVINS
ncbi:MAG: hypothetical protein R6X34_13285, partial [Chloroflexota bacterium]